MEHRVKEGGKNCLWTKSNEQNKCRWKRQMVSFVMGCPGLTWCLMGNGYYSMEPKALPEDCGTKSVTYWWKTSLGCDPLIVRIQWQPFDPSSVENLPTCTGQPVTGLNHVFLIYKTIVVFMYTFEFLRIFYAFNYQSTTLSPTYNCNSKSLFVGNILQPDYMFY